MANLPSYENIRFLPVHINKDDRSQSWKEIQEKTGGFLTDWGVEGLRAGLDDFVTTVVIETPYVCEDFRSLHRHFYGRKFRERTSKCVRLHFFSGEHLGPTQILLEGAEDAYIGSSVIEPLSKRCIGRTVLDPSKLGHDPEKVHLLGTTFRNRIGGLKYDCRGYPFRSQNNEATVCAHVTMWAVCRYLSTKFKLYRKHLPFELIEMAGRRNGRVVPHHGLNYADYSEMLDRFGCHPVIVANHGHGPQPFSNNKGKIKPKEFVEFQQNLYAYIESGFPLISTFGNHVVSIIGHTLKEPSAIAAKTQNNAGPMHASELVDRYVVMDDNCFPYQFMGRTSQENGGYPNTLEQLRGIVVPLPDEIYLRPQDVELFIKTLLKKPKIKGIVQDSLDRLKAEGPLIYRPFIATGASLKAFKLDRFKREPGDVAPQYELRLSLPKFVWCVELSTPSLRAEDRAFGEILLDATAGESDLEPIFARIGPYIARYRTKEDERELEYVDMNPYHTFTQYRHNLGTPPTNA